MMTPTLLLQQSGRNHEVPVGSEPLHIGRAPDNGLSLLDERVSWHHAIVWMEDDRIWVRDLHSTNGTFINGERLRDTGTASDGDQIRLGEELTLQVRGAPQAAQQYLLEDLDRGVRFSLPAGDLRLDGEQAAQMGIQLPATLHVAADGLSLTLQGSTIPLTLDEPFSLLDTRFRVRALQGRHTGTVGQDHEPFPYRLSVDLNSPRGAEATLLDRQQSTTHTVSAENRVVLLYMLAKKVQEDRDAGVPPTELGWCQDADLVRGIWGRTPRSSSALSVLVHRLRKEFTAAGLDHRFLEKERKILRARLVDVVIS